MEEMCVVDSRHLCQLVKGTTNAALAKTDSLPLGKQEWAPPSLRRAPTTGHPVTAPSACFCLKAPRSPGAAELVPNSAELISHAFSVRGIAPVLRNTSQHFCSARVKCQPKAQRGKDQNPSQGPEETLPRACSQGAGQEGRAGSWASVGSVRVP